MTRFKEFTKIKLLPQMQHSDTR